MVSETIRVVPRDKRFTDIVPANQEHTVARTDYAAQQEARALKRKRRPARRQVEERASSDALPPQTGQVYNVWYGAWSGGDRFDKSASLVHAETKCVPARDSGWTRADRTPGAYFCLFFARGCCAEGPDCKFLHRTPTATDIYPPNVDCFGRDKHADYRDDMGGTGSFLRQNHTLYVGRITSADDAVEAALSNAFCAWGAVERIRVLNSRGIAFVTYAHLAAAEFAKEAMTNQSLDNDEVLNVKWAAVDPNPQAAKRDAKRAEEQAAAAIRRALPQEFLDELEGKPGAGSKKKQKRLDYGLEGYTPSDELWYERGDNAINPAGRPKAIEAGQIEPNTPDGTETVEQKDSIISNRALQALAALKRGMPAHQETTVARSAEARALVVYGSDDDDDE